MRIQHNIPSMNAYRNYNNNGAAINKNLEKLSSGYKINRAGDDAAGLAVSEKMRWQITGLNVAQQNCKDAIGMIQTGEGALTEVHSMLNRMYELAMKASNGTYDSATDRTAMSDEFEELKKEIDRIGKTVNFNGRKLFAGQNETSSIVGKKFMIGERYEGGNNVLSVSGGSGFGAQLSVGTLKLDSVTIGGTVETIQGYLSEITDAINKVSLTRARLGAYQNRMEHTMNNLSVMEENVQNAESNIRDTDVAAEMMKYTKNNIMLQSAQAMLAQANQQPQGVLQLLQ
jgi:flagellin